MRVQLAELQRGVLHAQAIQGKQGWLLPRGSVF